MEEGLYHRAYDLVDGETQAFYAEWAATYDEELVGGKGYALPARCSNAFARHVRDRSTNVVDLGCGTGLLGSRLSALGFSTIDGIDYSPEMLERARETGAYRSLWSADLNEPLDIPDGTYGAAAVMGVFSFAHVYAGALDEMRRILRPDGALVIGVNEVFVDEGSLVAKLDDLCDAGLLELVEQDYGDHMPASGVNGWVYVLRRRG